MINEYEGAYGYIVGFMAMIFGFIGMFFHYDLHLFFLAGLILFFTSSNSIKIEKIQEELD